MLFKIICRRSCSDSDSCSAGSACFGCSDCSADSDYCSGYSDSGSCSDCLTFRLTPFFCYRNLSITIRVLPKRSKIIRHRQNESNLCFLLYQADFA